MKLEIETQDLKYEEWVLKFKGWDTSSHDYIYLFYVFQSDRVFYQTKKKYDENMMFNWQELKDAISVHQVSDGHISKMQSMPIR